MFDYIEDQYKKDISSLATKIKDKECCAFIGAGLSKDANYPTWDELLNILKEEAENQQKKKIIDDEKEKYDRAEDYKNILGNDLYYEIIVKEFTPDSNKKSYLTAHLNLIGLPFSSYITTNYDCLLENASIRLGKELEYCKYPTLPRSKLRERKIFHIHGIINHLETEETKGSVILTRSDFNEAYDPRSDLYFLITSLYAESTIFFLGFNPDDEIFLKIINECKLNYDRTSKIVLERGNSNLKEISHYALLPYKYLIKKQNNEENNCESKEINFEQTARNDADLLEKGIKAIRYKGSSKDFSKSHQFIDDLYQLIHGFQLRYHEDVTYKGMK